MLEFFISAQTIRFASPVIAANSLDYLEAAFHFSSDWDDSSKWVHFKQDETVYDIALTDDAVTAGDHLNLTVGQWQVYVTGTRGDTRLTTVPVILTVQESGLVEEPLHQMPLSVAEQVDLKAEMALRKALAIEEAADSGAFDGRSFFPLAYYESLDALCEAVPEPESFSVYAVGSEGSYRIYSWDSTAEQWRDNGSVTGVPGEDGADGATFTPHMSDSGILTWTNNAGLENPEAIDLTGPRGVQGAAGVNGKSPYQIAVEEGFTGTQATFNQALSNIACHGSDHEADGSDPVSVSTQMLQDNSVTTAKLHAAAVTRDKLGSGAVSDIYTATISTVWTGDAAPYSQTVSVPGMTAADSPVADAVLSSDYDTAQDQLDAYACIYRIVPGEDCISVYSSRQTDTAVPVQLLCIRR